MVEEVTYGLTEYNGVFEIPIYRLTNEKFQKELDNYATKVIPYSKKDMEDLLKKKGAEIYDEVLQDIKTMSEYGWKFNEIIGWVTIRLNQGTIFEEIFLKKLKRITKNSKAKIAFHDFGFKIPYDSKKSNFELFNAILAEIEKMQLDKKFRHWHIDISKFKVFGQFADWKKMYAFLNN